MTLSPFATTMRPHVNSPIPLIVDLPAAEAAATAFLAALGIAVDTAAMDRTAARMAGAYAELLTLEGFEATTFPNTASHHDLVIARAIPFTSICAHHLLPFVGIAHVGYLPGAQILGLSKLARVVELFAARPQVQEDMTQQIASWLDRQVDAVGVGVMVTAEHLCMTRRGAEAHGATAATTAWRGALAEDHHLRQEFLSLAQPAENMRSGR